jgi:hypothetical protein
MLSRRQFLTCSGIALLGITPERLLSTAVDLSACYGRTLDTLDVYAAPSVRARVVKRLWADSIVQVIDVQDEWLQLTDGYVERSFVQAMLPYQPDTGMLRADEPFWGEVAAPVAPVYRWAAVDAPLVTRVGHGGVLRVSGALLDGWYKVESVHSVLGWTQAVFWRAVPNDIREFTQTRIEVHPTAYTLSVFDGERVVLQTPYASSVSLVVGAYAIESKQAGGAAYTLDQNRFEGVPWHLGFGGYEVIGAYWHNQFGKPYMGNAIQISPLAARWLYQQMQVGDSVVVAT